MKTVKRLLLIGIILIIVSCKNDKKDINTEKTALVEDTVSYKTVSDQVYYALPSPEEVMQIITESNISFSKDILSPIIKPKEFIKQTALDINIGIYVTDMLYCGLFNKQTETRMYMDLLAQMSSRIYLSTRIKLKLNDIRGQGEITPETFKDLSNIFFYEIITDLESTEQQKTVVEICTGAYVESLYLSLESFKEFDHNNPMFKKLAEQKFAIKNILAYMGQYENEKDVKELLALLKPIDDIYGSMPFTGVNSKAKLNSKSKLTFSGGKVYTMDENTYALLKTEVERIRNILLNYR